MIKKSLNNIRNRHYDPKHITTCFLVSMFFGTIWTILYYISLSIYPHLDNINIFAYIVPVSIVGMLVILSLWYFPTILLFSAKYLIFNSKKITEDYERCSLELRRLSFIVIIPSICISSISAIVKVKYLPNEFSSELYFILFILSSYSLCFVLLITFIRISTLNIENLVFYIDGIRTFKSIVLRSLVLSLLSTLFCLILFLYFWYVYLDSGKEPYAIIAAVTFVYFASLASFYFDLGSIYLCFLYTILSMFFLLFVGLLSTNNKAGVYSIPFKLLKLGSVNANLHIYDNVSSFVKNNVSQELKVYMLSSVGSEYIFRIEDNSTAFDNATIYRLPKSSNIVVSYPKLEKTVKKKPEKIKDNKVEKFSTLKIGGNLEKNRDKSLTDKDELQCLPIQRDSLPPIIPILPSGTCAP